MGFGAFRNTTFTRRSVLAALATSPLLFQPAWAQNKTLKISHQFPGGTINEGDFRDRMTRMFAAEVEKRSKGSLKFEIYPGSSLMKTNAQFSAMRKGALDLSLVPLSYAGGEVPEVIPFRLEEVSKALTTGRNGAYWFMFEPLMMSRSIFDALTKEQQATILTVGAELEAFAMKSAKADDIQVAAVYQKVGAKVVDLNPAVVKKWQAIARATAWKDYGEKNDNCAKLLKLAEKTL